MPLDTFLFLSQLFECDAFFAVINRPVSSAFIRSRPQRRQGLTTVSLDNDKLRNPVGQYNQVSFLYFRKLVSLLYVRFEVHSYKKKPYNKPTFLGYMRWCDLVFVILQLFRSLSTCILNVNCNRRLMCRKRKPLINSAVLKRG